MEAVFQSRNGQAFVRELLSALDAMKWERLITDVYRSERLLGTVEVCAVGAMMEFRGVRREEHLGYPGMLCDTVVRENDRNVPGETDEQRWTRMRAWAQAQLLDAQ